jgi:MFS family permease
MFYQLRSFDETLPDSTIAAQAGLMASSFTGAQFLTAMLWGRVSDSDRGGRKLVLLIGLFGTGMIHQASRNEININEKISYILLGVWILKNLLPGYFLSNSWRSIEW